MTDQSSPITPPPELRAQWRTEAPIYRDFGVGREEWLMNRAAQWGSHQRGTINEAQLQERADQELEACIEWLAIHFAGLEKILRAARRPKPATLNSIALQMLGTIERDAHYLPEITDTIRRALETPPMTDPTPNAPMPTPLSPAAQAIVKAFDDRYELLGPLDDDWQEQCIAAALRAAATADQNKQIDVPFSRIDQWENIKGNTLSYWTAAQWGYQKAMSELLAIATELENQP